jgi:erythronate-4-phosphate dehydrogenase
LIPNASRRFCSRPPTLPTPTIPTDEGDFRSLDDLVQQADVITFHTPLYKEGQYKTLHLADDQRLIRQMQGFILPFFIQRGMEGDDISLLDQIVEGGG